MNNKNQESPKQSKLATGQARIKKQGISRQKSAQDMQDKIFRKMSVALEIKLMSDFFRFARDVNPEGLRYGTGRIIAKNRRDTTIGAKPRHAHAPQIAMEKISQRGFGIAAAVIIIAAAALLGGGIFMYKYKQYLQSIGYTGYTTPIRLPPGIKPQEESSPSFGGVDVSNWKTYRNDAAGYELKYPIKFSIDSYADGVHWRDDSDKRGWVLNVAVYANQEGRSLRDFIIADERHKDFPYQITSEDLLVLGLKTIKAKDPLTIGPDIFVFFFEKPNGEIVSVSGFDENMLHQILSTFQLTK